MFSTPSGTRPRTKPREACKAVAVAGRVSVTGCDLCCLMSDELPPAARLHIDARKCRACFIGVCLPRTRTILRYVSATTAVSPMIRISFASISNRSKENSRLATSSKNAAFVREVPLDSMRAILVDNRIEGVDVRCDQGINTALFHCRHSVFCGLRHGFPLFTAIGRVLVASFYASILTLIYDASNPPLLQEQKSA